MGTDALGREEQRRLILGQLTSLSVDHGSPTYSIHYSDPLWIALAFFCGLLVRGIGLPPMIGFLAAGFALNLLGAQGGEFLNATADLGITLLLFPSASN